MWAAEAAWAAANRKVEMQQAALVAANNTLQATINTPLAKLAHQAVLAAEGRLEVRHCLTHTMAIRWAVEKWCRSLF